jgi:hypothetical protein
VAAAGQAGRTARGCATWCTGRQAHPHPHWMPCATCAHMCPTSTRFSPRAASPAARTQFRCPRPGLLAPCLPQCPREGPGLGHCTVPRGRGLLRGNQHHHQGSASLRFGEWLRAAPPPNAMLPASRRGLPPAALSAAAACLDSGAPAAGAAICRALCRPCSLLCRLPLMRAPTYP